MTSSWFLSQGAPQAILHDEFWKSDHDFLIAFHSKCYLWCMVSEKTRYYCKLDMTSSRLLRQGAPHAILHDEFWKSDHDFMIVFYIVTFYLWCMISEITRFHCKPDMTLSWFLRQGSLHAILHDGFCKSDHDFLIAFHSNFLSVMHGFRDNEVLLQTWYDVIVISPPGTPQAILHDGFWKGDPDFILMFNWNLLSILNGSDVIRLFLFGWDFSTGGEIVGVFGQNDPKTSNWRKTLAWTALPYAKLRLLSHCAWNYLYPFGLCRCARKKAGRKAGRKKSHKKCIFHVSVERSIAGGMQPNLANLFFSRT